MGKRKTPITLLQEKHRPKRGNVESVRKYLDYDYYKSLPPEAKAFLNQFNEEYYFNRPSSKPPLHKTKAQKLSIWSAQNARLRCAEITPWADQLPYETKGSPNPEDALIEMIDLKRKKNPKKK